MLKVNRPSEASFALPEPTVPGTARVPSIWASLGRRRRMSALLVIGFVGLGLAYGLTSTPLFTASNEVLIDARRVHADEGAGNRSLAELGMDTASIDSQVAILGSEAMAIKVLKTLHLENDASFAAPTTLPSRLMQALRIAWRGDRPLEDRGGIRVEVLDGFTQRFDVRRVQQTYVLSLSFADPTAERAATIVNAFATLFANEQIESAIRGKDLAAAWLRTRLNEATQEVAAAEQALRSFRAETAENLIASGKSGAGTGPTTAELQDRGRDLERALNTKKSLYEALVQQAQSAIQRQTMPVSSVTVLSEARPPIRPSRPNLPLILAVSLMGGLASALAAATLRDLGEATFRVPSDVEAGLRLRFIGALPRIARPRIGKEKHAGSAGFLVGNLSKADTPFAETLRAAKVAADEATRLDGMSVLGVVSVLPGEGRSTVAASLADLFAAAGRRVLLVDADLRRPSLSLRYAQGRRAGLIEVLEGSSDLDDAIVREARRVDILPAFGGDADENIGAMLELSSFGDLLSKLHGIYDTVVLDLPPLVSFTEVLAAAPKVDGFLMVVGWGSTRRDVAAEALRATPAVAERSFGVVLNKADLGVSSRMKRDATDRFFLASIEHPRPTTA